MKNTIGKDFMKMTEYPNLNEPDQQKGIEQPPVELSYDHDAPLIDLPDPKGCELNQSNIRKLIEQRRSLRKYEEKSLTLDELSYLLWSSQGIKKEIKRDSDQGPIHVTYRTVPSAGARHPFETYLLINHVDGLTPGIYRYISTKHKLIKVMSDDQIASKVVEACYGQVFIETSAVTFIWVCDVYRTKWRYDERSYRYVLLDAGHVCQNLYLSAESVGAGVCAIAAYNDEALNQLLQLDGEHKFAIYLGAVGKRGNTNR